MGACITMKMFKEQKYQPPPPPSLYKGLVVYGVKLFLLDNNSSPQTHASLK